MNKFHEFRSTRWALALVLGGWLGLTSTCQAQQPQPSGGQNIGIRTLPRVTGGYLGMSGTSSFNPFNNPFNPTSFNNPFNSPFTNPFAPTPVSQFAAPQQPFFQQMPTWMPQFQAPFQQFQPFNAFNQFPQFPQNGAFAPMNFANPNQPFLPAGNFAGFGGFGGGVPVGMGMGGFGGFGGIGGGNPVFGFP